MTPTDGDKPPVAAASGPVPLVLRVGGDDFDALAWGPANGIPVLLLHGFPEGAACWGRVGPLLALAGVRAVAPGQRGYSPRVRPADVGAYALERLVDDAEGFLDALGWPTAHVVGHDWGAVVAWVLAGRSPGRLRSLTAVSVPHPAAFGEALATDPDQRQRSAYIGLFRTEGKAEQVLLARDGAALRAMFAGSGMDAAAVDSLVAPLLEDGALTAALAWYRAMRPDHYAAVPPVEVPTTFVWGEDDIAVSRTAAEGAAGHVRGAYRFVPLAGVGHWVPEQVPERLATLVLDAVSAPGQGG